MSNRLNAPFMLSPIGKDYLWGGTRLKEEYKKNIKLNPLAETWECSIHPDGKCYVSSGMWNGKTLDEVLKSNKHYLGENGNFFGELPIIVKLIDANKDLSVQVHPSDDYAYKYENGQLGKTEVWYVIDAKKGSKIVYGLSKDCSKEEIEKSIYDGNLEKYLNYKEVNKDDVYVIEAGTIHAIGEGCLIAEIQENSNLTYRLYDYDRKDAYGQKRQLHIEKAIEVANMKKMEANNDSLKIIENNDWLRRELLYECKYFKVECWKNNSDIIEKEYCSDEVSYHVLLCLEGNGVIKYEKNREIEYNAGDCIFIPANSCMMTITGKSKFLDIYS